MELILWALIVWNANHLTTLGAYETKAKCEEVAARVEQMFGINKENYAWRSQYYRVGCVQL